MTCHQCGKETIAWAFSTFKTRKGEIRRRGVCRQCRGKRQEQRRQSKAFGQKGITMRDTQLQHAMTAISLLHRTPGDTRLIEITALAQRQAPVKRWFTKPELAAEFALDMNDAKLCVFCAINTRNAFSGFERNVPEVTAMALDLQPERTSIETVGAWLTAAGIAPTAQTVSGYGAHMYFLLSEAADPHKAKLVWERLCKITHSDAIFNTNRILRLPGSRNWKKTPPRWCYFTGLNTQRQYTLYQIDRALDLMGAPPARSPKEGIPIDPEKMLDWPELRKRLHASVLDIIDTGEKNAFSERQVTRSEADWLVICALVRAGASDEMIHGVYETEPVGMLKYRSAGAHYLLRTIESARRATADTLENRPHTPTIRYNRPRGSSRDDQRGNRRMYK